MVEVTVRVELWVSPGLKDKLTGLIVAVRPGEETETESDTVPFRPRLLTFTLDVFEVPDTIVRLVGFVEMVKSLVMVRPMATVWVVPPPEPLTVIV